MFAYVQPVAYHVRHPERLLVRSADGEWYLWFGDRPGCEPEDVPPAVASWMQRLPSLVPMREPHFWLHRDDLPLTPEAVADDASR
jgi:hypothetical protein